MKVVRTEEKHDMCPECNEVSITETRILVEENKNKKEDKVS